MEISRLSKVCGADDVFVDVEESLAGDYNSVRESPDALAQGIQTLGE